MPNAKISQLPAATQALVGNELVVLVQNGITKQTPLNTLTVLASYSKSSLPSPAIGTLIYVTDESGGAQPAFADGVNWRRVTDRAVVS